MFRFNIKLIEIRLNTGGQESNSFLFYFSTLSAFKMPPTTDPSLQTAADAIPSLLLQSVAHNTVRSYAQGFRSWNKWCRDHEDINNLPVKEADLAIFIVAVVQENGRIGRVEGVYNGLNWIHKILGLPNPCSSPIVQGLKEAAKRLLSRPVRKKEPLTPRDLRKLYKNVKDSSLIDLRTLTAVTISYAGFLRYDEVSRIRREHIQFKGTHMTIFLDSSKPDQYNVGDLVHVAATGRSTCPVSVMRRYLEKAGVGEKDTSLER